MAIHVLGIRHHGPGSAKNVKQFLEKVQPDLVLVEGPPDADPMLQWVSHAELKPPVAILCYQPENPDQSTFYPFATFSPEWQAILYARTHHIPVRFMDLPASHHFALESEKQKEEKSKEEQTENSLIPDTITGDGSDVSDIIQIKRDPVSYLAEAAGYSDGEKWWEQMFEYRRNNTEVFDAVTEAMQELREQFPGKDDRIEKLREAYMRKVIRQGEKEMFTNIAVVCGAWHVPALVHQPKQKEDNELLKALPKTKVECTWIPWTYNRLSLFSGYGAGIASPGWYEHTWQYPLDDGTRWMAKVAKLFREKQMDTSVAHVMESVRLAESLASLRQLSKAGLEELNEATLSVLCNGESVLMSLVHDELIVSDRIGEVPLEIPKPPLQVDIEKLQKRLRLPVTADWKDYTLDLRKEGDLERSIFLHRLRLLEIKWGVQSEISGKGTFKEQWRLQWDPAFSIDIIEKGNRGNTVEEAASNYVIHLTNEAVRLPQVCALLEQTIPAELPAAIEILIRKINNLAATGGDVVQLMMVIPSLVNVSRYGNVRKTDAELVTGILESMIIRICVSLPSASTGIDEEAAAELLGLFAKMHEAVNLLQHEEITKEWQQTVQIIAKGKNTAPVIAGYALRLLYDYKLISGEDLVKAFHFAMSSATTPSVAAAWLEGFLKGSGTILLIDNDLWMVLYNWVDQLPDDTFIEVLPLLRRTFSNYSTSERRKLGGKVSSGGSLTIQYKVENSLDEERAKKGIPVIMQLLGYS